MVVFEYQDNVFVFREARSWPGYLDSVAPIEGGLKEGWACDVCIRALAYELPLFSKSTVLKQRMLYSQAEEHYKSYL